MGGASSVASRSAASVDARTIEALPSQGTREDAELPLERLQISVADGTPTQDMPAAVATAVGLTAPANSNNTVSGSGSGGTRGGSGGWAAASVVAAGGSLVTRSGTCTRNNSIHFDDDDAAASISLPEIGPTTSSPEGAARDKGPDCGVPAEAMFQAGNSIADGRGTLGCSSSICRPDSSTSSNTSCRVRETIPVLKQPHDAQADLHTVFGPLDQQSMKL